jgi:hypothetical protein
MRGPVGQNEVCTVRKIPILGRLLIHLLRIGNLRSLIARFSGAQVWQLCLGVLLLGDLAACSIPVKRTGPFNHALDYVPWSAIDGQVNAPPAFQLKPGMRVTFNAYSAYQLGEAFAVPLPAGYQYVVPTSPLGPADYFFLSYVLTAGHALEFKNLPGCPALKIGNRIGLNVLDLCIDPVQELDNRQGRVPQIAAAMLQSLALYIMHIDSPTGAPDSAGLLKAWFTSVDQRWLGNPNPSDCVGPWQRIAAQAPFGKGDTNVELDLFDWSTPAFTEDPFLDCGNYSLNRWYQGGAGAEAISQARGYVTVEIPVHIVSDAATHHIPMYWSYADLEQALSAYATGAPTHTIKGFRRNKEYLPDPSAVSNNPVLKQDLIGDRDYFTVWFSNMGRSYGAQRNFAAEEKDKAEFLVAPGDVIYIQQAH